METDPAAKQKSDQCATHALTLVCSGVCFRRLSGPPQACAGPAGCSRARPGRSAERGVSAVPAPPGVL
eukprot:8354620-Heterocapsa_arctica.AAC.1